MQEINQLLIRAQDAYVKGDFNEVLTILANEQFNDNSQALFLKGETCYKLQKWGDALNYFSICSEKDPSNTNANTYIEMINNILVFRNTDFLNP
jgi:hypothetical protein